MQSQFSKNILEAKQSWIYAVLLLSVGPVGPGGGIYSIIEDNLCPVYLLETFTDETFTHRRHLLIASIRYDARSIRYLIVVAYGYLSREN